MSRLLSAALLPALLLSCADEEIVGGSSRVQEGLPARIALKVVSNENRIETRAAQPGENEQRVTNLYLLVFDEYGKVCDGSGLYSNLPGNSVILTARSKNGAQIAGIANVIADVSGGNVNTTYQLTESQLKAVTTKTELLALLAKLDQQTLERSSQFIMSGWATDIDGNDIFNIPGSENSGEIATFSCNLKLSRLDAKVEFVVKTEIPDGKAWKDLDFRPKGWRVVNVPAQSLVMPKETGDADSGECTYFNTDEMPFETVKRNENYLYESADSYSTCRKTASHAGRKYRMSPMPRSGTPCVKSATKSMRAVLFPTDRGRSLRTVHSPMLLKTPLTWKCLVYCLTRLTTSRATR